MNQVINSRDIILNKVLKSYHPYILVFKTDIVGNKDIDRVRPILDQHHTIISWNIDRHDIDNVLRVESVNENTALIIDTLKENGFFCEELPA